jgi:hypothetical protein
MSLGRPLVYVEERNYENQEERKTTLNHKMRNCDGLRAEYNYYLARKSFGHVLNEAALQTYINL